MTDETPAERSTRHMAERAALVADSDPAQHDNHGASHTPGPWLLDKHGTIWANGDGVDDGTCLVMDVFDGNPERNSRHSEMARANARLIASAPELLAALIRLRKGIAEASLVRNQQGISIRAQADAALAKALGQ